MREVFQFSLNTTMELIAAQTNQIQIYGHPTRVTITIYWYISGYFYSMPSMK
jgi:hypothetical protein